jgi:glycosyltransferase involved in cell wall biosynthesis
VLGGDRDQVRGVVGDLPVRVVRARTTQEVAYDLVRWSRDADVVHVHMTAAEAAALLARPVVRAPVVATRHFASTRGSSRLGRVAAPLITRMVSAELSISQFVAESTDGPSEVVTNGVASGDAIDPTARAVLVAQRLEPEKHTRVALDAWHASHLADDGWTLRIAGGGTESARLRDTVARLDLRGVELLGHRSDVATLMRHSSVLLATAPSEPFGFSVAEAMAVGLPVVAAHGGGHLETVGRATPELLYPADDSRECARILRELASDVERRRAVGTVQRAFQREHLDLDAHVDRLLEIYRSVHA